MDIKHRSHLRQIGGSVMLAVPPAVLNILDLAAGDEVRISVESGRLVVEPAPRPGYTLGELLAQCDPKAGRRKRTAEEQGWLTGKPVGGELI